MPSLREAQYRHAKHYLHMTSAANDLYLQGGDSIQHGLNLFDLEWVNIQAGQAWAATHSPHDDVAAQLCSDYSYAAEAYLSFRAQPGEQIHWLECALNAARRLNNRDAECKRLNRLGIIHSGVGQVGDAIEFFEQALKIARQVGDLHAESAALNGIGIVYTTFREIKAIEFQEQALTIARELGDIGAETNALFGLGCAYAALNETRKAIEFYEQGLKIVRQIGNIIAEGSYLTYLGVCYNTLGETRKAIEYHEQALKMAHELDYWIAEEAALVSLMHDYARIPYWDQDRDFHQQLSRLVENRFTVLRDRGAIKNGAIDGSAPVILLGVTGEVSLEPIEKIKFYEYNLKIAREMNDADAEDVALVKLCNVHSSYGMIGSYEFYEQALRLARRNGYLRTECSVLAGLGDVYAGAGEAGRAIEFYELCLDIASREQIEVTNAATIRDQLKQLRSLIPNNREHRDDGVGFGDPCLAYVGLGDKNYDIEFYNRRVAIAHEVDNRCGKGLTLFDLSLQLSKRGNRWYAIMAAEAALEILEQIDEPKAAELHKQLSAWRGQTDLPSAPLLYGEERRSDVTLDAPQAVEVHKAIPQAEAALKIFEAIEVPDTEKGREVLAEEKRDSEGYGGVWRDYDFGGSLKQTPDYYKQELLTARNSGDKRGEANLLFELSRRLDELGQRAEAIAHAEDALRILQEIRSPRIAQVQLQIARWREQNKKAHMKKWWQFWK